MVILPDYQGIGLGKKLLEFVAEIYKNKGFDYSIKTSAKNLITSLKNSNKWCFASYDKSGCSSQKNAIDYKRKSLRTECKTASFFYK